nr:hypothetical protein [Streptomyces sp. FR1]
MPATRQASLKRRSGLSEEGPGRSNIPTPALIQVADDLGVS